MHDTQQASYESACTKKKMESKQAKSWKVTRKSNTASKQLARMQNTTKTVKEQESWESITNNTVGKVIEQYEN